MALTTSDEAHDLIPKDMLEFAHSSSESLPTIAPSTSPHLEEEVNLLGRGHRQRYPSIRLHDYVTNTIQLSPSRSPLDPLHSSGTPYPLAHYVNCDKFSMRHRHFLAVITAEREPVSYSEAV
uniref:Uncharacterized protein n=1 Tax=Populus alba TaxID=43335 RepID=A0A4U5QYC8_POPAL|nr:hypothetical protein D5086_0000032540 [Populus alba]